MTVLTYTSKECATLAAFLVENPSGPIGEAGVHLVTALQDCPHGARVTVEIEPLEEEAVSTDARAPVSDEATDADRIAAILEIERGGVQAIMPGDGRRLKLVVCAARARTRKELETIVKLRLAVGPGAEEETGK
jgi:hypothetical protein